MKRVAPIVMFVLGLLSFPTFGVAQDAAPLGLWMSELVLDPLAQGPLVLTIRDSGGQATLGARRASATVKGDSVVFRFADGAGRFLGRFTSGREAVEGFWVQPGKGPWQGYATPTRLQRAASERYTGTITPLEPRFTMFLYVWSDTSGLRAALRNPEFNIVGGASRWRLRVDRDSLHLTARPDTTQPEVHRVAVWDRRGKRIRLFLEGLDSLLVMKPCGPKDSVRFWPRMPRGARQAYRVPTSVQDGWTTARASSVGLDELALAALTQSLADTNPVAPRAPLIHSCLIERHGRLVYEEYFYGHDREQTHDTRSGGKTFASVLVGAAMRQGAPIAPDSSITGLMKARGPFANPDPRKSRITLGQLMSHTSGLACDDNDEKSPGNEDVMQQSKVGDWWKYTLDLPMAIDPGTRYAYCSGGMNLVGGGITAATGRWIPELFDASVARPLGYGPYHFNLQPTDEGYLGGGIRLRPRDLLKLGRAYLDGGVWRGHRIVDSSWVTASTRTQWQGDDGNGDGYAWHLIPVEVGGRKYREYEANGNGGQMLIVIPELDLSVVFTAGNYMNGGVWWKFRNEIVGRRIIAAIRDR